MSSAAILVLILTLIGTLAALILGVPRVLAAARRQQERAAHIADDIVREGFSFSFTSFREPAGRNSYIDWVEYSVQLPRALSSLGLVDVETVEKRKLLMPVRSIISIGAPSTEDQTFDGLFDFTERPSEAIAAALQDPEVRRHLLDIRRAYGGLWVDHGTLRVYERDRPDEERIDVNLEYLSGVLLQLHDRLIRIGAAPEARDVVLDTGTTDAHADEHETSSLVQERGKS